MQPSTSSCGGSGGHGSLPSKVAISTAHNCPIPHQYPCNIEGEYCFVFYCSPALETEEAQDALDPETTLEPGAAKAVELDKGSTAMLKQDVEPTAMEGEPDQSSWVFDL
jgi:hypothetical protein